jgi:hypothetical protein
MFPIRNFPTSRTGPVAELSGWDSNTFAIQDWYRDA